MNAILLGLESLLQQLGPSDDESKDILECLSEASVVMSVVLNDVQTFQQIEEGLFKLEHESISLRETIQRATDTFRIVALARGVQFQYEISSDIPDKVEGDRRRIVQVLEKLLSNAIKFNKSSGETVIEVRARVLGWHVGAEKQRHRPRGVETAVSAVTI